MHLHPEQTTNMLTIHTKDLGFLRKQFISYNSTHWMRQGSLSFFLTHFIKIWSYRAGVRQLDALNTTIKMTTSFAFVLGESCLERVSMKL